MTDEEEREVARILSFVREELDEVNKLALKAEEATNVLTMILSDRAGFTAVTDALISLDTDFPGITAEIDDKISNLAGKWNDAIAANKAAILEGLERAEDVLDEVKNDLASVAEGFESANEFIMRIGESRDKAFAQVEQAVETSFEEATETTDALEDAVLEQFQTFSDLISTLVNEIDDAIQEASARIDEELEQPVKVLSEKIDAAIAEFREFLVADVKDELLEQVETTFMNPAKEEIAKLIEKLEDEIIRLGEEAIGGSEGSAEKRQELALAVDILRSAIDPVLEALGRLQGLAGTVGITI